jgi:hypothetical protein
MALRARSTAFEKTVSWSCTKNGCALSPMMGARNRIFADHRLAGRAVHLVDHVFPVVPVGNGS